MLMGPEGWKQHQLTFLWLNLYVLKSEFRFAPRAMCTFIDEVLKPLIVDQVSFGYFRNFRFYVDFNRVGDLVLYRHIGNGI